MFVSKCVHRSSRLSMLVALFVILFVVIVLSFVLLLLVLSDIVCFCYTMSKS